MGGERIKPISEIINSPRLFILHGGTDDDDGLFAELVHPCYKTGEIVIVASWGGGWEHVSVSLRKRCPTWDEMCMIKDIFWGAEECVIQYHPPRSEYINIHPHCLHLWKKIGAEFETPPKIFVGV